jgi:probable F420-dependent oxidoreductase
MRFTMWESSGDADVYFRLADAAENHGWHSMCLHESVFYPFQISKPYPYSSDGLRTWPPDTPFLDPLILLTGVLARTTTLRAYTCVLKFPLRHPLLVAKQAATIATMSGNRFGLGVGQSVWPEEFLYTGTDFESRKARMLEGIEIVRLVTSGEVVEYHGEHYDFGPLQQAPGVTQRLPIYVGGHRDVSLRLAAEHADGWCGTTSTWEETERCVSRLYELLGDLGRSADDFEIHAGVINARTVDDFRRMEEMGITDAIVRPWMQRVSHTIELPTEEKVAQVKQFGDEVIAAFSSGVVTR